MSSVLQVGKAQRVETDKFPVTFLSKALTLLKLDGAVKLKIPLSAPLSRCVPKVFFLAHSPSYRKMC